MSDSSLSGRTALITGGAKGIGRACCVRLARAGADVAINYLTSERQARETADLVAEAGATPHLVRADVSSAEQVQAMVAEVTESLGPIELLVNNAGIFHHVPHQETTAEIWRHTLDVNLTGAYLVTWAVKQGMLERRFGRIVNVASISALRARPMSIAYAVSKAGMIALTQSLSAAVAANNVRVNAVAPGLIDTEIIDGVEQSRLDELVAATPMARIGEPEEIASLVCFLLSEESSFMTGQTVVASGGRALLP